MYPGDGVPREVAPREGVPTGGCTQGGCTQGGCTQGGCTQEKCDPEKVVPRRFTHGNVGREQPGVPRRGWVPKGRCTQKKARTPVMAYPEEVKQGGCTQKKVLEMVPPREGRYQGRCTRQSLLVRLLNVLVVGSVSC